MYILKYYKLMNRKSRKYFPLQLYYNILHCSSDTDPSVMGMKQFCLGKCWKSLLGCCHLSFILKNEYLYARKKKGKEKGKDIKTSERQKNNLVCRSNRNIGDYKGLWCLLREFWFYYVVSMNLTKIKSREYKLKICLHTEFFFFFFAYWIFIS